MEVVKDLGHKSDEEWLRELGMLSLQKRRFRRDPITPYIFLKEGFRQVGFSAFSQVTNARSRQNELFSGFKGG